MIEKCECVVQLRRNNVWYNSDAIGTYAVLWESVGEHFWEITLWDAKKVRWGRRRDVPTLMDAGNIWGAKKREIKIVQWLGRNRTQLDARM